MLVIMGGEKWGGQKVFPWSNQFGKHWAKEGSRFFLCRLPIPLHVADGHCESKTWDRAVVPKFGIIITNSWAP